MIRINCMSHTCEVALSLVDLKYVIPHFLHMFRASRDRTWLPVEGRGSGGYSAKVEGRGGGSSSPRSSIMSVVGGFSKVEGRGGGSSSPRSSMGGSAKVEGRGGEGL